MKKLLLVDGYAVLFRAYYATAYGKPMTTKQGLPTNAVFGFASMLQKAIDIVQPDAMLVAFDAGSKTFRHDIYTEYKGGRKPAPEDLVPQFGMTRNYCEAYGIKWVEKAKIEADDVIGTVSKNAADYETFILSSDRDLFQLVDDSTSVIAMKKGLTDMEVITPAKIKEMMGIEPLQIIDLKGLMGDASDNYPGIPGVGEKSAIKLLNEYGSVENVLAHENEIKGALGKKVIAGHDSALMSKTLATIKRDVELDLTVEDCAFNPTYKELVRFFETLDMKMMASRYEGLVDEERKTASTHNVYTIVKKIPEEMLKEDSCVFVDDDRSSFLYAQIHGFAIHNDMGTAYITIDDARNDEAFLTYLRKEKPYKIGYDIKRCAHTLKREGIDITFHDDVMIMASLADSTLTSTDKIMDAFQLAPKVSYEEVYGKQSQPILLIEEEKQRDYGCSWACNIEALYNNTKAKLSEYGMDELYRNMEFPLTDILYRMEEEGIRCDIDILNAISDEVGAKITTLEETIYEAAGEKFNINSTKQLAEVLYDKLALPSGKKRSTAADKLMKLKGEHPIIDSILEYRKLSKIYSTYAEGLKKYIAGDGKIHTLYNQCATQTGRLSSSEPNLQNISVKDEQGKEIRKAFLPEEGCVLIASDYHQIELRILAHMADEKGLLDAFNNDIDVHTKTAMELFDISIDDVTPLMRRRAKTVNFGIVYGISDFGLSEQLGVSRAEAHDFIEKYYESYPGIHGYMDSIVEQCKKDGYVSTLCGRRREIPEIHNENRMVREFGQRAAMNAPIQGTAADLIKLAMIAIDRKMTEKNVKSRMILQVHDELIFNVYEDEIDLMQEIILEGMQKAMKLNVELTCECCIGKDWYEAK